MRQPGQHRQWEAYSRANSLVNPETIEQLEASHCKYLIIGFESMSPVSLKNMSKRVTADQNVQAIEALRGRGVEFHGSFMAGYPGESPEDYEHTHRFLVDRYHGRFNVYIFMFMDETMPVWQDAPMYDLQVSSGWMWKHSGMSSQTAMKLQDRTIREVRWKNDDAVLNLWQSNFMRPMLPTEPFRTGPRIEKAIERLAFCVHDLGEHADTAARCRGLLDELESLGVDTGARAWHSRTESLPMT